MPPSQLLTLPTPCLLLDRHRMQRNIERLRQRMQGFGVRLRPHLKTAKSVEIARLMMESPAGPATVSTLKEAEQFAAAGVRDIIYAVGISPGKLDRVTALRARGVDLAVILDSVEAARAVAKARVPAWVEIDTDGHRAGIAPNDTQRLLAVAREIPELRGVLTHAGESYRCATTAAIADMAEQERAGAVRAAEVLREAGLTCPGVSVGSTPTAHFARSLEGVTEVRAGVYVFMDLVMAGLGVCALDDIAISVLTTVIGHRAEPASILVDAGWMAMSRDRGTAAQRFDYGYGLACDAQGVVLPGVLMTDANQEHGVLRSQAILPRLAIGERLRVLPNHACATAAQFDFYHLQDGSDSASGETWPRFSGW